MTIGDRVYETTTTTGTGNITLAGAVSEFDAFSEQFAVGETFNYWIHSGSLWEQGIGHLSASTTLVRDQVILNSTGGTAAISLTGTSDVYSDASSGQFGGQTIGISGTVSSNRFIKSKHLTHGELTNMALVANRIYYVPYLVGHNGLIDGLTVGVRTASGAGDIHLALYDRGPDSLPGKRLLSVTALDPSSTGFKTGTFTAQSVKAGWYWLAIWCDVTPNVFASQSTSQIDPTLGLSAIPYGFSTKYYYVGASSLTELPDPANVTSIAEVFNASPPANFMRASA